MPPPLRPYAELRTASAFSFLDGSSLPEDLIAHAAANDLPAMALIERNGVYGAPRFFMAAKKAGVKALIGAELVLEETTGTKHPDHGARLSLLVENREGYKNLCKLLTAGAENRPKGEARFTWKLIEQYTAGLRCLTGGDEGPLAHALGSGGMAAAEEHLQRLTGLFPGRTHVELQRHYRRGEGHRKPAL